MRVGIEALECSIVRGQKILRWAFSSLIECLWKELEQRENKLVHWNLSRETWGSHEAQSDTHNALSLRSGQQQSHQQKEKT